jgi:hypothetical protein
VPDPITRDGELSEQSLVDAVAAERADGRRPARLMVGSEPLRLKALGILSNRDAGLDALAEQFPRVELDSGLDDAAWQLREAA